MASIAHLATIISARTERFDRRIKRSHTVFSRFVRSVTSATGLIGGAGLSFAFVRLGQSVEGFNQEMTSSIAIMGDVGDAMREDMERAAIDAARTTKFSATEAAKSYFFLASAGLDAAQSIKALPAVARFAQAGMFDMALATDLLTDAQSALGLSVDDAVKNYQNMVRVSDVLVKANTLANASVQQFSEALTNKAGAKLKAFGIDVEEGVAVLAAYADQGLKASEAGTAYAIVIRDLTRAAIENKDAFEEAAIAVFDERGEFRNAADIVGDLEEAMKGLSDEMKIVKLLSLGIPTKSVGFTQALLGSSEQIREYEEALRNAAGTTDDVANKQMTQWAKGWNAFTATISGTSRVLQPTIDFFGRFFESIAGDFAGTTDLGRGIRDALGLAQVEAFEEFNKPRVGPAETINEAKARATELADILKSGALEYGAVWNSNFQAWQRAEEEVTALTNAEEVRLQVEKDMADVIRQQVLNTQDLARATREAESEWASMESRAAAIFEATRNPLERLKEGVEEIQELAGAGILADIAGSIAGGIELEERALADAREEFERATRPTRSQRQERIGFGRELDRSIASVRGLQLASRQVQKVEGTHDKDMLDALNGIKSNTGRAVVAVTQ